MEHQELISLLETRFEENPHRHPGTVWEDVKEKLTEEKCGILLRMEESGGEPDVVALGDFDLKSQSWLRSPEDFRKNGEALFGTKRNGRTFVYYNGAESYYRIRGCRCRLTL